MLKKIDTKKAPAAIGPYSQAIVCGNMLFTSGQIPIDPATGDIHGADITEQAEQVMKNLAAVLEEAGTTFENAVKTTCFLADMGDFAAFNAVYGKYFTEKPARSALPSRPCRRTSSSKWKSSQRFNFRKSKGIR